MSEMNVFGLFSFDLMSRQTASVCGDWRCYS